jgi:hypothetical protein
MICQAVSGAAFEFLVGDVIETVRTAASGCGHDAARIRR